MLRSAVVIAALVFAACGDAPNPRIASHVSSTLRDSTNADGVWVTVAQVEAHRSGGWVTLVDTAQRLNLVAVSGDVTELWDEREVPPGHYTQVRLLLENDATVVIDGEESPLGLTSQDETGLKVVGEFTAHKGHAYVLVLDFELDENLHENSGGWVLKPTVKIESFEETIYPD